VRILSVSHYGPPHVGGLEYLVDVLASRLSHRGHEVTAVTSTAGIRDGLGVPRAQPFDYRMIYVRAWNRFFETRLGVPYPLFSPSLISVLRQEIKHADVVHAHGFLYQSSLAALVLARRAQHRPPVVLTEHVGHVPYPSRVLDGIEAAAIASLGRWSARAADTVVVYNTTVRETISRLAPGTPLAWIDTAVDTEFFHPPSPRERARSRAELGWDERPRVLFAGRAVAKKGLDVALEAARVADGAFVLAVAGTSEPPPHAPHVERIGLLSRELMATAMRAADALIMSSRGEGLPVTIHEALASGLPVVATDDPSYRTSLDGAGPGVRLVPADGPTMALALKNLLTDDDERSAAASAAVSFARRHLSLDNYATQHEDLYAQLVDTRAPPGVSSASHRSPQVEVVE
jgi:D-inositol-3-phosphate glycosyltransferase